MLDIGLPELLIILAIMLVVFGPGRLAGVGKAMGESIRGFRQAFRDEQDELTICIKSEASNATPHDATLVATPNKRAV